MTIAPPDRIAESLAGMFVATFVGLSLPVVGVGIALSRHVSPKDTILGFAIAVSAGIAVAAIKLVGDTTTRAGRDSPDGEVGHHLVDDTSERRAV
jgi:hypothetical protein